MLALPKRLFYLIALRRLAEPGIQTAGDRSRCLEQAREVEVGGGHVLSGHLAPFQSPLTIKTLSFEAGLVSSFLQGGLNISFLM